MKTIVLQVAAWKNGRMLLDKRLSRVRIDDGPWRPAKTADFETAIRWIMANDYALETVARPPVSVGSVTVNYIYRKTEEEQ